MRGRVKTEGLSMEPAEAYRIGLIGNQPQWFKPCRYGPDSRLALLPGPCEW